MNVLLSAYLFHIIIALLKIIFPNLYLSIHILLKLADINILLFEYFELCLKFNIAIIHIEIKI